MKISVKLHLENGNGLVMAVGAESKIGLGYDLVDTGNADIGASHLPVGHDQRSLAPRRRAQRLGSRFVLAGVVAAAKGCAAGGGAGGRPRLRGIVGLSGFALASLLLVVGRVGLQVTRTVWEVFLGLITRDSRWLNGLWKYVENVC